MKLLPLVAALLFAGSLSAEAKLDARVPEGVVTVTEWFRLGWCGSFR